MSKRLAILGVTLFALSIFSPILYAQTGAAAQGGDVGHQDWWANHEKWNTPLPDKSVYAGKKAAPAPRRDLSGAWDGLADGGTQPKGAKNYPDDASHRPEPPYTPLGREARARNKPGEGEEQV